MTTAVDEPIRDAPAAYFRRWGGSPLRVIAHYRQLTSGTYQTRFRGEWVTIPGDSLADADIDTMIDTDMVTP